jgi:hypothetical protein
MISPNGRPSANSLPTASGESTPVLSEEAYRATRSGGGGGGGEGGGEGSAAADATATEPLVLAVNTGNGFGAAFGGVAEASGERDSFSELRDNFTKRRTEDKRQTIALGDYLDGDPRKREMDKSPVIVAADLARRKTTSKLGDWLDSPSNKTKVKTGGEAKESEGKTNWLKAKSKILAKVRDDASPGADGSKITRTSTFAGVAKDVVEKQRKMSASAVAAPRRKSVLGQDLQLKTRRRTAIGMGEISPSPTSSPSKRGSVAMIPSLGSPVSPMSPGENNELKEDDEEDDEDDEDGGVSAGATFLERFMRFCRVSDRTHPGLVKAGRAYSADFLFRQQSSEFLDSIKVRVFGPAIVDQSTVKGLELYLDINAGSKEFVLQKEWPQLVILPDSGFLIVWQLLIAVAVMVTAFATPFDAAFLESGTWRKPTGILGTWSYSMDVVFVMDIIVNFITGVRDIQGHVKIKGSTIALAYAKSPWLTLDVVSVIPWDLVASSIVGEAGESAGAVKTLKLLRLFRLSKVIKRVDEFMEMGALQVFVLILGVAMFLHWISCGWRLVGCEWMASATYEESDLEMTLSEYCERKTDNYTVLARMYGVCLAQACGTMLGSGAAVTLSEQVYFASVIIMGAVMQASVFGSIAKTMAQMDEDRHKFDRQVAQINYRMRYLRLPEKVQTKVIKYYENLWNFTKTSEADPDKFIDTLSPPLRGEMKLALYRNMLTKMPYLRNLDVILAERLVMKLKSVSFMKGDFIMRVGEPGDWLAFLEEGTAAILDPSSCDLPLDDRRVIRVMEVGDYFGEVSLFFGTRRTADVLAMSWTILELLDAASWDELKRDFNEEMMELETSIKADTSSWMKSQRK